MATDRDPLREAIRRTLAQRAETDATAISASILATWEQIALRLTPIIGAQGVGVLFGRALHLTRPAFPWLSAAGPPAGTSVTGFQARLERQAPAAAMAAGCELLLTFTELLGTLIGRSLSAHLLAPVWGPPSVTAGEETSA